MSESLPLRPDLNWLKNRAKERLVVLRAADPAAQRADALLAVAKDYGFASWRALKREVEGRNPSVAAASSADSVLKRFKEAISRGDAAAVETLLASEPEARANVNAPIFSFDSRPIMAARQYPAVVDVLLAHGADINLKSAWWAGGFGILDRADSATAQFLISRGAIVDIFAAAHLNQLERVRELLDADPALVHAKGGDGGRPLHFAASLEMIDLLLDRGAEIDARDVDHAGTAAQWMMPQPGEPLDRVRRLVERGAAVDPFMAAALNEVPRLAAFLDADPSLVAAVIGVGDVPGCPTAPGGHQYVYWMGTGRGLLEIASAFNASAAAALLKSRSSPQLDLLVACATADRDTAERLLREQPGLLQSIPRDNAQLTRAAWNGNTAAVQLMLDVGFDPAASGTDVGGTALHAAAWHGRAALTELILSHPASRGRAAELVAIEDPTHHSTPLGWCCHGSTNAHVKNGDYAAVARLLLAAGSVPGPNLNDASGEVRAVIAGQVSG
jgi:ankyrin repeat protein